MTVANLSLLRPQAMLLGKESEVHISHRMENGICLNCGTAHPKKLKEVCTDRMIGQPMD